MGIASSMRDLTQNIASSHEDRTKTVAKVKEEASQTREEARDLIKGFQASREELKAELKEASAAWQGLTDGKNKVRRTKKWESQQE
ncbi:MAG TPA: hypothetical protein VMW37_05215 [Dehalococcoidales bacterium]|nr:hypothetical protein [Dehalococcoidales bacterium]